MLNFHQIKTNYPKAHEKLVAFTEENQRYCKYDYAYIIGQVREPMTFNERDLYDFFGLHDIKITFFGELRFDAEFEYMPMA